MESRSKKHDEHQKMSKYLVCIFLTPLLLLYVVFIAFLSQQNLVYTATKAHVKLDRLYSYKVGNDVTESFVLESGSDTDLIYFQGSLMADNIHVYAEVLQKATGYNIIFFVYRGFGQSKGRSSEVNIMVDLHILKYFMDKRKTKVNVFGHSLGCAAGVYYAHIAKVNKLLLNNPFMNVKSVIQNTRFYWMLTWLLTEKWQTDMRIGYLYNKILITCSQFDEAIDPQNSRDLVKLCKNGELLVTKYNNHEDALYDMAFYKLMSEYFFEN